MLSHRGAGGDIEFDPAEESLGTMVWLGLSGPILDAIAHGDVLLVDEIEASLHRRYRTGRYGATPILTTEEFAEAALSAAGEQR